MQEVEYDDLGGGGKNHTLQNPPKFRLKSQVSILRGRLTVNSFLYMKLAGRLNWICKYHNKNMNMTTEMKNTQKVIQRTVWLERL